MLRPPHQLDKWNLRQGEILRISMSTPAIGARNRRSFGGSYLWHQSPELSNSNDLRKFSNLDIWDTLTPEFADHMRKRKEGQGTTDNAILTALLTLNNQIAQVSRDLYALAHDRYSWEGMAQPDQGGRYLGLNLAPAPLKLYDNWCDRWIEDEHFAGVPYPHPPPKPRPR